MDITGLVRVFFFSIWQITVMIFVDGFISLWAFWSFLMISGILIYEYLVLDISFDTNDSLSGESD